MTSAGDERASAARFKLARRTEWIGMRLAAVGFLGSSVGALHRWIFGIQESDYTASTLGMFLVWLFAGTFVGGLLVILPASSLLLRRAQRLGSDQSAASDEEGNDKQWELSPWLAWPLWTFTTISALWLIYMLLRYGIPEYFARGR
jgi:hypothetical protein